MAENYRTQKKTEQAYMQVRIKKNASFHIIKKHGYVGMNSDDVKAGCAVTVCPALHQIQG